MNEVLVKSKNIIANKYATNEQLDNTEYFLKRYLTREKDAKAYNLLGKLYLRKNDCLNAKINFEKSQSINEMPSNYYGLFQVNVYLGEYKKAKENLINYKEKNTNQCNIDFYILLLRILSDYSKNIYTNNYNTVNISYINVVEIKNKKLKMKYQQLINEILERKYQQSKTTIEDCQKIIYKYNIKLDLNVQIELLNEIETRYKKRIAFLKEQKEVSILRNIKLMLNKGYYEQANDAIMKLEQIDHKHQQIICLYKKAITEKTKIQNINEKQINTIKDYETLAKKYCEDNNLDECLNVYICALLDTKYNQFNYYIGKILYKQGNYTKAIQYLNNYNGYEKYFKNQHYLKSTYIKLKDKKKANEIIKNLNEFRIVEDKEYDFIEVKYNPDFKQKKLTKKIKLEVEDFVNKKI